MRWYLPCELRGREGKAKGCGKGGAVSGGGGGGGKDFQLALMQLRTLVCMKNVTALRGSPPNTVEYVKAVARCAFACWCLDTVSRSPDSGNRSRPTRGNRRAA